MAKLKRIYSPDRETSRADVIRYKDYSEELETIEEIDLEYEEEIQKFGEEIEPQFRNGRDYMAWLRKQLPCIEPFEPEYAVHYYFFRSWSKNDLKFLPELEGIIEMDDKDHGEEFETKVTPADCSDVSRDKNDTDHVTTPEFESGQQLLEWLENKLPNLEPFAPNDSIHYYFKQSWRKEKYVNKLELLEEEDTDVVIGEADEIGKSTQTQNCSDWDDENLHPYIKMMVSPMILEEFKFKEEKVNGTASVKNEIQKIVQMREENIQLTSHLSGKDKKTEIKDRKKKEKTDGRRRHNFLRRLFGR